MMMTMETATVMATEMTRTIGSLRYRRFGGDGDVVRDYDWGEIDCACGPAVFLTSATYTVRSVGLPSQ